MDCAPFSDYKTQNKLKKRTNHTNTQLFMQQGKDTNFFQNHWEISNQYHCVDEQHYNKFQYNEK